MSVYFSVVHNRTNSTNKSQMYTVNIRVTINRKVHYLSIPDFPKIHKQHWHTSANQVANTMPTHYALNTALRHYIAELDKYHANCLQQGMPVTWQGVRHFFSKIHNTHTFTQFARRHTRRRRDIQPVTKTIYLNICNYLDQYRPNITLKNIDRPFVEGFAQYLQQHVSGNTTKKMMIRFRRMYLDCCKEDQVHPDVFLFEKLNIRTTKPKRQSVTPDELTKLDEYDLTLMPNLQKARDTFILQCRTGLYYRDLQKLKMRDLKKCSKGHYITGERFKNDNYFIIPLWLFPEPMEIIHRYQESNHLIDITWNQDDYNRLLKELVFLTGIRTKITNKVARHTFTDTLIAAGVPRALISRMLGHTKEETTSAYYDVSIHLLEKGLENWQNVVY